MGGYFSTNKVSGSNSNTAVANHHRKQVSHPTTTAIVKQEHRPTNHRPNDPPKSKHVNKPKPKATSRCHTRVIPCGKLTNFGSDKNFDRRYTTGKLLGHGQFGYTYVANDRNRSLHSIQISCGVDAFSVIKDIDTTRAAWDTLAKKFMPAKDDLEKTNSLI